MRAPFVSTHRSPYDCPDLCVTRRITAGTGHSDTGPENHSPVDPRQPRLKSKHRFFQGRLKVCLGRRQKLRFYSTRLLTLACLRKPADTSDNRPQGNWETSMTERKVNMCDQKDVPKRRTVETPVVEKAKGMTVYRNSFVLLQGSHPRRTPTQQDGQMGPPLRLSLVRNVLGSTVGKSRDGEQEKHRDPTRGLKRLHHDF